MLRSALMVFAVLLILAGFFGSITGAQGGLIMSFWGFVLLAAVLFERWRYRRTAGTARGEWQPTDERFVDPETGKLTQVIYNPQTGDRLYQPVAGEQQSSPPAGQE
jgi:hypothetical protein